jgi:hypothetical protein
MPGLGLGLSLKRSRRIITPGFSPLSLSPALWLDASDSGSLFQSNGGAAASNDGDPVGYWMDKSGNGKHATQTSGTNKPTLKTAIQNGKNIVRTNGTSSFMNIPTTTINAPFTIYLVIKKPSSSAIMELAGISTTTARYLFENYSDTKTYFPFKASGTSSYNIFVSPVMDFYSSFVLINAGTDGTTGTLKRNNNAVSNTPTNSAISAVWDTLFKGDNLFGSQDVAETIWYSENHDGTKQGLINTYLNSKWGIY